MKFLLVLPGNQAFNAARKRKGSGILSDGTQRWHAHHHTAGAGHVCQGRFKSLPVQSDGHFLRVARYVERNPLRANLVSRAEQWPWSSLWRRTRGGRDARSLLAKWPVDPAGD